MRGLLFFAGGLIGLLCLQPIMAQGPDSTTVVEPPLGCSGEWIQQVDLEQFLAEAKTGVATLVLDRPITMSLTEKNYFNGGRKVVKTLDSNGTVTSERPLDFWFFTGLIVGETSSYVRLQVDRVGLRGVIRDPNVFYEMNPTNMVPSGLPTSPILVEWLRPYSCPADGPDDGQDGTEVDEFVPTAEDALYAAENAKIFEVLGYLDNKLRTLKADAAETVAGGYSREAEMWEKKVGLTMHFDLTDSGDFSTSTDCGTHLAAFTIGHSDYDFDPGDAEDLADVHQLFTGRNLNGCYGIAQNPSSPGQLAPALDSVVEAYDHSSSDDYDPDEVSDIAIVSGQEMGHNFGEPDHNNQRKCIARFAGFCYRWSYNIMSANIDPDKMHLWIADQSLQRIRDGTKNASF